MMNRKIKWIIPAVTAASLMFTGAGGSILMQNVMAAQTEADGKAVQEVMDEAAGLTEVTGLNELDESAVLSGQQADALADVIDIENAVQIDVSDDSINVIYKGASQSADQVEQLGIAFEDGVLSLDEAGTYVLSGSLKGQINVSSSKSSQVTLVLNGITVESETESALSVKKTETLTVYLAEGTENILTSGQETQINEESEEAVKDTVGGAFYSKAQTVIAGPGSLTVNGYLNNGIQVTKSLTVESGSIEVNAINNGIKVKQTYEQNGGDVTILSGDNGIKAEQEAQEAQEEIVDETTGQVIQEAQDAEEASGYVIINDGNLNIDSYGDAIQAYLDLVVNGGNITLKTEGEYPEKGEKGFMPGGESQGRSQGRSQEAAEDPEWPGGIDAMSSATASGNNGAMPPAGNEGDSPRDSAGFPGGGFDMESMDENPADNGDSTSEKGLKSDGTLTINSGTIVIDTVDDAIHSSGVLTVNGGEITITTGDDGLHSDVELLINDGTVNILKAYEGIEANQITVAGGDISVVTTDDGINANGGSASFGGPGGESRSSNAATDMPNLNITGGNIYVNSAGDGLDSNGDLTITGGYTVVDGPSDAGNGALDCGTEIGGKMIISGGVLFAGGSAAMVEPFDSTSAQASVKCILPSVYSEGTIIKVTGADGTVYFEHKAQSAGNSIIFSCPELKTADTFTLTVGDAEYEITLSSVNAQFNISADGTIEEGASTGAMAGMPGGSREQMGEYKE